LTLRKGIPYLLEAVAGLRQLGCELWLIGSVDDQIKPILARYEGLYRYLGVIPRARLPWYYSQCSVLVLPSIEDGLGAVQVQAMACGLPVIATANTGAEDLFTHGVEGFVLPIRSREAIRERLVYLRERPEKQRQMATAALQKARSWGGWSAYGRAVEAAYTVALRRERPGVDASPSGR
jgi:glycosyltransferase involved in cell wall biosynthesis